MKKSLFEMLGIADQERIHTQVLAWLLSPTDSPLDNNQRSTLIEKLFGINTTPDDAANIRVVTELKRLDLVVLHPNAFIAVENKMKSRQGDSQLEAYSEEIKFLKTALGISQSPEIKFFLTFSGEDAPEVDWKLIDYQYVLDALTAIDLPLGYATDYTSLLNTLLNCRNDFLKDHRKYREIFNRSGMDTFNRLTNPLPHSTSLLEQFVCGNRLERIFIERLYREAIIKAGFPKAFVSESRGKALIDLTLFRLKIANSEHWFNAGFQLQGNTIKLNMAANQYEDSKSDWLPEKACVAFDEQFKNIKLFDGKVRANGSRSHAYRSWSRAIESGSQPQEITFDEFCEFLIEHISDAISKWDAVLKYCHKLQIVTEFKSLPVGA